MCPKPASLRAFFMPAGNWSIKPAALNMRGSPKAYQQDFYLLHQIPSFAVPQTE
jgi:hypothetical protein